MSPTLHHECTRVPITALIEWELLLVVAEGPYLRFYDRIDNTCLRSHKCFKSQAIHGILVLSGDDDHFNLVAWGGVSIRTIKIALKQDSSKLTLGSINESKETIAPDWILDVCSIPSHQGNSQSASCVAVTAHNALLEVAFRECGDEDLPDISVTELTSSSRSILYSAHLKWDSQERVLVAAGTAFGEIIYWSWDRSRDEQSRSRIHHVFLGHEGSIFGVQISGLLDVNGHGSKRLLASCSDDRTIRIWDVTDAATDSPEPTLVNNIESERTRHTGFSNETFDPEVSSTDYIAIGWGHTSRVWKLTFLETGKHISSSSSDTFLVSSGEDATSRTWKLVAEARELLAESSMSKWQLQLVDTGAYHNGKNVWSVSAPGLMGPSQPVTLGGADSKITRFHLPPSLVSGSSDRCVEPSHYQVKDVSALATVSKEQDSDAREVTHRSSKQAEFFRSYAFVDESSLILSTNSGKIFLETSFPGANQHGSLVTPGSKLIAQLDDLSGYSVCAGEQSLGVAFIAGSKGTLYTFQKETESLEKIYTVNGKIGEIFLQPLQSPTGSKQIVVLVTLVGQKSAQLLHLDLNDSDKPTVRRKIEIPIFDHRTGLTVTSMTYINTTDRSHVLLGFRRGSIAAYQVPKRDDDNIESVSAELSFIIDSVHGKETVTAMTWVPETADGQLGYLASTGRDSAIAYHLIDLERDLYQLVHQLTLPVGPNIEGIYVHENHLYVYGFSSKKFVFYNTATEEEVMSVETGGAHRSWAFNPKSSEEGGGTLVWTRASSMHRYSQRGANHTVIRSGGHGREIKAVTASPLIDTKGGKRQLIATGAEDTDIKIFTYENEHLTCHRTLRRHTTGIQCLQWSPDGSYLFSSGGCEEFYVWRISHLPLELGAIGVVCEAIWTPESEHADLRIMAFDVAQQSSHSFIISMVFSNSMVKIYDYDSSMATKWNKIIGGLYFTSCLTQCIFLDVLENSIPHTILTAGTDGHAVLWSIPDLSESAPPHQAKTMSYQSPLTIHQSSSKTLAYFHHPKHGHITVSGGDDGSIAFMRTSSSGPGRADVRWKNKPVIVVRTHASAVTACAVLVHQDRIYVLSSGNDQWVRLWEVVPADEESCDEDSHQGERDWVEIKRLGRVKTSVADVSSMAVLMLDDEKASRVLICGVGMEVVTVRWDAASVSPMELAMR